MSNPQVSIIVPVYNTAQYLNVCIDSILNQTFADFELILINDGSKDCSLEICREYVKKDQRVSLIDKKNEGVSCARNSGIETAVGIWVAFIDSDDYICQDYLENLVRASGEGLDFVQSGIVFFNNETGAELGREILPQGLYLNRREPEQSFRMATLPLITSPVSKLYRRELLLENNIRFNLNISVGEDRDFNLTYLGVINKSCAIDYAGYYYRKGIYGNLSSNKDYIQLLDWDIDYIRKLKNFFESNGCDVVITDKYLAHRLFNIYNDRLIQYVNSQHKKFSEIKMTLKDIVSHKEYAWLCQHFDNVDCNQMTALIYKSKSPILISTYLKTLSRQNG